MVRNTKFWYINTNKLFAGLSREDKEELLAKLKEISIKRREFAYLAGERADKVYLLKEGRIKVGRLSEEGRELTIDILGPGDIFGELTLAGEDVREASAVALEDSYICAIDRADFEDYMSKRPYLSLAITKMLGRRLRKMENRLEHMIFQDVRSRLLSTLKELAREYAVPIEGGTKITVNLTHQELANLIGATRETVTLELNNLRRNGYIRIDGRELILVSKGISKKSLHL